MQLLIRFWEEPVTLETLLRFSILSLPEEQVRVTFMDASKRSIIRNVKVELTELFTYRQGPIREGDILTLMEWEREARRLR